MNCLDYRRQAHISPRDLSESAQRHESECAQCADIAQRLRNLDSALAEATRVRVPEGLLDRVLPDHGASFESRRRFVLSAAAGLIVATGAGSLAYLAERDDPLALAGIAFVVEDEANAILHARPTDTAALVSIARQMHVKLPEQLGEVRYVGTCPFEGTIAHHVIVTTPQGKATLLLLPEIAVRAPGRASARGLQARVIPAAVGSIAMVAMSSKGLERIGRYISDA